MAHIMNNELNVAEILAVLKIKEKKSWISGMSMV
jgi:hypothetical protein